MGKTLIDEYDTSKGEVTNLVNAAGIQGSSKYCQEYCYEVLVLGHVIYLYLPFGQPDKDCQQRLNQKGYRAYLSVGANGDYATIEHRAIVVDEHVLT